MTAQQRQQMKEAALREAVGSLLQDSRFLTLIETIRELREQAMSYAAQHTTVKDERECLAALGEFRAWNDFLAVVEAQQEVVQPAEQASD